MELIQRIKSGLVAHATFPVTNLLYNRRGVMRYYRRMLAVERYSEEQLREIQLCKLKKVIHHAYKQVPFYRRRFEAIGLEPGDVKALEVLDSIPPLTRQDVIDHHKEMLAGQWQSSITAAEASDRDPGTPIPFALFAKDKLVRNTSSGSTGAPTVFYEDGTRSAVNWAHELRLKQWFGVHPGAREARGTRLSTDYMPNSRMIRFRKLLWNQLLLPGTNMSDADYEICFNQILEFRPEVLWGFTSALAGLADFIVKQGGLPGPYAPKVAVGWAAPVYDHEHRVMQEGFQCPVSNIYGAREVGHIAGRCPSDSFHINAESLIVEQIELDGHDPDHGGELLVTDIDVLPMPFIRYRMGDIGKLAASHCECGRTLPVIENLLGRTGEVFYAKSGRMISPNFWCRTFMNKKISGSVRRFQVIYTKEKDLRIKIEQDYGFSAETEQYINETVQTNFGSGTQLSLEFVEKIKPEISGKYLMVRSESE